MDESKKQTGSRGGEARAKALSPEKRREIAQRAAIARWNADALQAIHEGDFSIGSISVSAAVLPNGKRLLTQGTFLRALGRSRSPKAGTGVLSTVDGLPFFLQAEVLRPLISDELMVSTTPIFYIDKGGRKAVGYDANLLPQVAEVYLKLRDEAMARGKPVPKQYEHIIKASDVVIRGLARVGIIALVDEATGYQDWRAKDALARILERFIAEEIRKWVKTFPDDFYKEMFRLRGWGYPPASHIKPAIVGKITNKVIYERLAPGVLDALRERTPRDDKGRLKHRYHQLLTDDIGHPKLREHLAACVALMKVSSTWAQFEKRLDVVAPRFGHTYVMELER